MCVCWGWGGGGGGCYGVADAYRGQGRAARDATGYLSVRQTDNYLAASAEQKYSSVQLTSVPLCQVSCARLYAH